MITVGWLFAFAGFVLFVGALVMTVRANREHPIPFYRSPVVSPAGSVLMRGLGAGLFILGAGSLVPELGYGSILVVLAAPVAALVIIVVHNRRVAMRERPGAVS